MDMKISLYNYRFVDKINNHRLWYGPQIITNNNSSSNFYSYSMSGWCKHVVCAIHVLFFFFCTEAWVSRWYCENGVPWWPSRDPVFQRQAACERQRRKCGCRQSLLKGHYITVAKKWILTSKWLLQIIEIRCVLLWWILNQKKPLVRNYLILIFDQEAFTFLTSEKW